MPIEITMPGVSSEPSDGVVVEWRLAEGERAEAGQVVVAVETDKAVVELEAPAAGVLAVQAVAEDAAVAVGGLVAVLAGEGEDVDEVRQCYAGAVRPRGAAPHMAENVLRTVPLTGMRGAVSRRVVRSSREIPQFHVTVDCDVESFLAIRRRLKRDPETRHVNINAMTLKCVAAALVEHPRINATLVDGAIHEHALTDINLAVGVPGGVVMPVIRGVFNRSLSQVSRSIDEVIEAARHRRLRHEDMEVGTFSVSSLGSFGVRDFTALILPPQVGILAVGTIRSEPVIRNGEVAMGQRVALTISVDHRAIDGAVAAEFMQTLQKNIVEQPAAVLR